MVGPTTHGNRLGDISIAELVALPHLGLRVLAGEGGLDTPVSWAHVSDAPTPWNWNEPGDLVMTSGIILPLEPSAQAEFIEHMAQAGLCGLVLGEDPRRPQLSARMLERASELNFPILSAHHSVSFVQHVRAVAAANSRTEKQSLDHITRVQDEVRLSLTEQRSSVEFIEGLCRVLGCRISVVDDQLWEPALPGCSVPDPLWQQALRSDLQQRHGKAPLVMRLSEAGRTALAMPVPTERSAYLFAEISDDQVVPRLAVLQHAAAACGLEMARVYAGFERDRSAGAALLSEAMAHRVDTTILDLNLGERGLHPPYMCIAVGASTDFVDGLVRRWAINGVPHLLGGIQPVFVGVVDAECDLDGTLLGEHERVRIGVSDPFSGSGGFTDAVRQAHWALETINSDDAGIAHYGDGGESFLPRTLAESKLVAERILGPVLEYDREHDSDLIETLRTYLECDRSPKHAAVRLYVHSQTVNYRIGRIQELTGRSMRSTSDISELWFALRALALSETAQPF
jgi:PucR family transcriptional regulator, purine catabolism regulatory protein